MLNEPAAGPGGALRAERERLGVSLREVSETLNLSITVVQAIEADDHARLPGPVFVRGYVRAYARLLGLEPEPLLAQGPVREDAGNTARRSSEQASGFRRRALTVAGGAALLLVLAVLAVLRWWPADDAGTGLPATAGQPVEGTLAQRGVSEPAPDEVPWGLPEHGDPPVIIPGGEEPPATASSQTQPATTALRLTPTGDDRLSLRFTEDCWVQVRDAGGTDLYSNLKRTGEDLELVGQGPLRILLGNAPAAQLAFNGEPVPLGPHTRNNVATLVLGQ